MAYPAVRHRAGWRSLWLLSGMVMLCLLMTGGAQAQITPEEPAPVAEDTPATVDPLQQRREQLASLATGSFADKRRQVSDLQQQSWPGVRAVLAGMLAGQLFHDDAEPANVYVLREQNGALVRLNPLDGTEVEIADKQGLKEVRTNNQLRRALRGAVARFDLADEAPAVRKAAIAELRRDLDNDAVTLMRERLPLEDHGGVRHELDVALALYDLDSLDADARLAALHRLSGELANDVYNRVQRMLATDAEGNPAEADARVRLEAQRAIGRIEQRRNIFGGLETLFFGLSFGSVLVLAAIGLAITFGVM